MSELLFPEIAEQFVSASPFTPRPYQSEAIEATFEAFEHSDGCLVRLPTGSGKTIVGSLIAERWISQGDEYHVLVICHERQLIWQFAEEIEAVTGLVPGIEMAGNAVPAFALPRITIASRPSLLDRSQVDEAGNVVPSSRLFKFDRHLKWLVIWDEAHRHAYSLRSVNHIVDWFEGVQGNSRRLGLTATPERTDKKSIERMFPAVACDYLLFDIGGGPCAVLDGYAVPYKQRYIHVGGVDFKALKVVAGDFDKDELSRVLRKQENLASLCEPMHELVGNRKTLIFTASVQMAKDVALYLNAKEECQVAEALWGEVPEEDRKQVYDRHRRGETQYLVTCGLCREGFNSPGIAAICIMRPTKSRPLAEQMKGRGCRPLAGIIDGLRSAAERREAIAKSDKPDCLIIDMVGATGLGDCASTAHIYAQGVADEVIERANLKLIELDGEMPIADAIEEAEQEIEREKAAAAREAAEIRAKQDAAKASRLKARATWESTVVEQGTTGGVTRGDLINSGIMSFGKYKGYHIDDVPAGYKRWMEETMPGRLSRMLWVSKNLPETKKTRVQAKRQAKLENRRRPQRRAPSGAPRPTGPATIDDINRMLMER